MDEKSQPALLSLLARAKADDADTSSPARPLARFDPAIGLIVDRPGTYAGRERMAWCAVDATDGTPHARLVIDVSVVVVSPVKTTPRNARPGAARTAQVTVQFAIHCPFEAGPHGLPAKVTIRAKAAAGRGFVLEVDDFFIGVTRIGEGKQLAERLVDVLKGSRGVPLLNEEWLDASYTKVVAARAARANGPTVLRRQLWGGPVSGTRASNVRLHVLDASAGFTTDDQTETAGRKKIATFRLCLSGELPIATPVTIAAGETLKFETVFTSAKPLADDPETPGVFRWLLELRGLPKDPMGPLKLWNHLVCRPYVDALRLIAGERHLTLLPDFEAIAGPPAQWRLRYLIEEAAGAGEAVTRVAPRGMRFGRHTAVSTPVLQYVAARAAGGGAAGPEAAAPSVSFVAQLPNVVTDLGTAVKLHGFFESFEPPTGTPAADASPAVVSGETLWPGEGTPRGKSVRPFAINERPADLIGGIYLFGTHAKPKDDAPESAHARVGALDLKFPAVVAGDRDPSLTFTLRAFFWPTDDPLSEEKNPPRVRVLPQIQNEQNLPLLDVLPGGDDPATDPAQAARGALVLRLPGGGEGRRKITAVLRVSETCDGRTVAHDLRLNVVRRAGGAASQTLVVLDPTPMSVARLVIDLGDPVNAAESGEIAAWTAGDGWRLASRLPIELTMPPQVLGEPFIKAAHVEGYPVADAPGAPGRPGDSRFAPPTRATLRASRLDRNLQTAPWNLRRILGGAGQELPGAVLEKIRTELLYGMSCEINAPNLRLVEMFARVGEVVSRQLDTALPWRFTTAQEKTLYGDFKAKRDAVLRAIAARLAVFEAYDDRVSGNLVLESGVQFRIRTTGGLEIDRYATPADGVKTVLTERIDVTRDPFAPNPKSVPRDPATPPAALPTAAEREAAEQNRRALEALPGGALWGFENKTAYDVLLKNPVSDAARIVNPRFSALGGWAQQKGEFDRRKTLIQSDTAMGRTASYTLERIGRIGVFWNLAKHVIVYERTVQPTAQFAPTQDSYDGLAVVRKAREYIEIIRPLRQYPENGQAPVNVGFVRGCEFKTVRINVTSDWGVALGVDPKTGKDRGWVVPLWRRDATSTEYPKPSINLIVATDGQGGTTHRALEEPDKLFFYTTSNPDLSADTDKWPAVEGVDYPDAAPDEFAPATDPADDADDVALNPADPDGDLPDAPAIAGGLSMFTWAVNPVGAPVNLVAGRAGEPILATLVNVSMARSVDATAAGDDDAKAFGTWLKSAGKLQHELRSKVEQFESELRTLADGKGDLASLKRRLSGITAPDSPFTALKKEYEKLKLGASLDDRKAQFERRVAADLSGWKKAATDRFARARADVDEMAAAVPAAVSDKGAKAFVQDVIARVAISVPKLPSGFEAVSDRLRDVARQADAVVEAVTLQTGQFEAEIATLVAAGEAGVSREEVSGRIDAVSARIGQSDAAVENAVASLRQRIDALVQDEARALAEKLNDALDRIESVVKQNIRPAREQALRSLNDLKQSATRADANVEALRTRLKKITLDWQTALRKTRDDLIKARTGAAASINQAREMIDKSIKDFESKATALADPARQLGERLRGVADAPAKVVEEVKKRIDAFEKELKDYTPHVNLAGIVSAGLGVADEQNIGNDFAKVNKAFNDKLEELGKLDLPAARAKARETIGNLKNDINRLDARVGAFVRDAKDIGAAAGDLFQAGSDSLRVLRAFGEAPLAPGMVFNRKKLAYGYTRAIDAVKMTPAGALLDRAGDGLKALGMRLPTDQIKDRLMPYFKNLDLGKLLPDVAGLKLSALFEGVKIDEKMKDKIKLAHGVDRDTRRAWVNADLDLPVGNKTLLNWGPIRVDTNDTRVTAAARVDIGVDGAARHRKSGEVRADWELSLGGMAFVVFERTALMFDDAGKVKFDISPKRVRMPGVLKFLSDMVSSGTDQAEKEAPAAQEDDEEGGVGFSIRPIRVKDIPVGVESRLDLKLPDTQTLTSGYANLSLGVVFGVMVDVEDGFDFRIRIGFNFASRERPFSLIVFILGGAGYINAFCEYSPVKRKLTAGVDLAVYVAASLAIAIGPVRGGVYAYLGITASYSNGAKGALAISALFILRGDVSVAGIITVSLVLTLEVQYRLDKEGKFLHAKGTLALKIKICWCFTIKVKVGVEYRFKTGEPTQVGVSTDVGVAADKKLKDELLAAAKEKTKQQVDRHVKSLA